MVWFELISLVWGVEFQLSTCILYYEIEPFCTAKLNQLENVIISVRWEVALGFTVLCPSYFGRLRKSAVQLL
ncbi:hypothetical protein PAHAL_8G191700 [Panicum hallii]|uniref:Uncharacterized protein n=1 Tax=Panicum hallii TaxID=206008 RepID=A0A2T8I9I2_9POAL|nr:hypothetical protein PAHAL_8G191700 [Panicum hallii]